jgi:predicted nuclease with TOPRIM domain
MKGRLSFTDVKNALGEENAVMVLLSKKFSLENEKLEILDKIKELDSESEYIDSQIDIMEKEKSDIKMLETFLNKEYGGYDTPTSYRESLIYSFLDKLEAEKIYEVSSVEIKNRVFPTESDNKAIPSIIGKAIEKSGRWVARRKKVAGKEFTLYCFFLNKKSR